MLRTPKADEMVVIYETRKNRVSGAHTQVIDLRPHGEKYAIRCVTHDQQFARNVRLAAEAESHHSETWCPMCTDVRPAPTTTEVVDAFRAAMSAAESRIDEALAGVFADVSDEDKALLTAAVEALDALHTIEVEVEEEVADENESPARALSADEVREIIGNASSQKTCEKRVDEFLA
jgi:adenine-specific DNA methylase